MNQVPVYKIGDDNHSDYIEIVELQERNSYDSSTPHKHEYIEVFLFSKGGGNHMIDFKNHGVKSKSVHFVFPNQIHKVIRELDTFGHVVLVSKEYFSAVDYELYVQFFHAYYLNPVITFAPESFQRVQGILQQMKMELFKKEPFYKPVVKDYLQLLIQLFLRELAKSTPSKLEEDVDFKTYMDLLILVESNYKGHLPISFYCDQLRVTNRKLNMICKKYNSGSCSSVVLARIVLEAKKLLLYSDLSIKDVMFALNYSDAAYFNRFFKSKTGSTPSAYKLENAKKYHN